MSSLLPITFTPNLEMILGHSWCWRPLSVVTGRPHQAFEPPHALWGHLHAHSSTLACRETSCSAVLSRNSLFCSAMSSSLDSMTVNRLSKRDSKWRIAFKTSWMVGGFAVHGGPRRPTARSAPEETEAMLISTAFCLLRFGRRILYLDEGMKLFKPLKQF